MLTTREGEFFRLVGCHNAPIGMRGQFNWSSMRLRSPVLARVLEEERMLQAARCSSW